MNIHVKILIGLLIFACITFSFATEQADLILYNGKVISVDANDNIFQAIAIKGEKILAVGTNAAIKAFASPQCKMIDAKG